MGNFRKEKAQMHTKEMEDKYRENIEKSVSRSMIYDELEKHQHEPYEMVSIQLVPKDSVTAAFEDGVGRTCILNFASYKHPGGGFTNGSKAQEECLCHESFLYNVLRRFPDYYIWNSNHSNRHLYTNRAIYSPDIVFEQDGKVHQFDVVTCAAPNYSAAKQYKQVCAEENRCALESRIRFLFSVIRKQEPDTVILGAWGCGVFGQNPEEVAVLFKKYLETGISSKTSRVIFAVPDGKDQNYRKFQSVFR